MTAAKRSHKKPKPPKKWFWVTFEERDPHSYVAGHFVSSDLKDKLIEDIYARFNIKTHLEVEKDSGFYIDYPGMIDANRPIEKIDVSGLLIEIPSENVCLALMEHSKWKVRKFSDDSKYHKLHFYPKRCLVLSPKEYKLLSTKLKEIAVVSEERAAKFYEKVPVPSEVLKMAAKSVSGKDVKIDLGGHHLDRFLDPAKNEGIQ